jgi:hypothetical protein
MDSAPIGEASSDVLPNESHEELLPACRQPAGPEVAELAVKRIGPAGAQKSYRFTRRAQAHGCRMERSLEKSVSPRSESVC